ncbi:AAA family ATPase [Aureivirga sp. CE67]|uniref:AAA family ATPase n=1 Tax=Aureivirga sp. CE67 TaxID=1788983 RepID=UPI0018C9E5F6|nr:AAA family ATPase [Aureivirga sp. CE67]
MKNLFDIYTSYNDYVEHTPLFTFIYDKIPSNLSCSIPLEESKENMEKGLEILDLKDFEILYKNWNTEDKQDAKIEDDYVFDYLFSSKTKELLVSVTIDYAKLKVNFYYHSEDQETEKWILNKNHELRTKLAEKPAPSFEVLTSSTNGFSTQEVKTEFIDLDIEKNYNEDFKDVHETISKSFESKSSGLILLHGLPGTGKTTYIKSLISKFDDLSFIFIQNDFVTELLKPGFISFLIDHKNAILIIEDAEKVIMKREHSGKNSVVSTILQLTDGLFSDYLNIRIICTFNSELDKIDKALLRKGRMIAYYDFKKLSVEKTNNLLEELDSESINEELTLAEIFNYTKKNFQQTEKIKIGF